MEADTTHRRPAAAWALAALAGLLAAGAHGDVTAETRASGHTTAAAPAPDRGPAAATDAADGRPLTSPEPAGRSDAGARASPGPDPGTRAPGSDASGSAADTTVVGMTNSLKFTPDSVTVTAGETVVWTNSSVLVHTVTAVPDSAAKASSVRLPADAEPFGSGRMAPGATYRHTFTVPGTYRYFCIPHEATGMVGTVVVEPDP